MKINLLRQKILDLAIRGKLVPQDPNDEPASVLLERIRAEKERLIAEGKIKRPKKTKASSAESHYQQFEPPFPIPESWEWVRLGELCCRFSTGPFGSALHKCDYCTEGTPLVNPTNIKDGGIYLSAIKRVCSDKVSELSRYILNENDIILARRGDLSKCAVISEEQAGWICGTGSFFLNLISISSKYFQIVYCSNYCQDYLKSESVGGTMDNLNQNLLSEFLIPIPPLSEQLRICRKLDDINLLLEEVENGRLTCIEIIESIKTHILDLAIQGKLVPQDPIDEPAAVMLRRINPKAKIISDNQHYPQLPDNWVLTKLGDVVKVINGKSQKEVENPYGSYPIYGSGGVIGMADTYSCLSGSTIIGRKGTINKPLFIETNFWNVDTAFGMKPNESMDDLYFYYFCISFDFTSLDKSSTLPSLTKSAIENITIPIPPLKEQNRIVSKIKEYHGLFHNIIKQLG